MEIDPQHVSLVQLRPLVLNSLKVSPFIMIAMTMTTLTRTTTTSMKFTKHISGAISHNRSAVRTTQDASGLDGLSSTNHAIKCVGEFWRVNDVAGGAECRLGAGSLWVPAKAGCGGEG